MVTPRPPSHNLLKRLEKAIAKGDLKDARKARALGATWGVVANGQSVWPNETAVWSSAARLPQALSLLQFMHDDHAPASTTTLAHVLRVGLNADRDDVVAWAQAHGAPLEDPGMNNPLIGALCIGPGNTHTLARRLKWAFAQGAVVPPELTDLPLRWLLTYTVPSADAVWAAQALLERGLPADRVVPYDPKPATRRFDGNLLHVLAYMALDSGSFYANPVAQGHFVALWKTLEAAGVRRDLPNEQGETPWAVMERGVAVPAMASLVQQQGIQAAAPAGIRPRPGLRRG